MKSNKRKTMVVLVIALFVASAVSLLPLSSAQETTVSIGDGSAAPDEEAIVSVMINNVPVDIMTADVTLTYNGSIVHVTSVDNSQFDNCLSTINNITGSTRICAYQSESDPLTGNVKLCDITLKAVGSAEESSHLNITVTLLEAGDESVITATPDNGTFTITGGDETPPTITDVSPENGSTDVSVGTAISATFSEAMNEGSAEAAFSVGSVAGTFSWAGNMMTFTPSSALAYDTTYTATVSTAAEDLAGNNLASDYTWTFTTEPTDETPPTITGVSPENGSTNVSVGTAISATFSEAMNEGSAEAAFSVDGVAGTFGWAGNMMTFTPSSALAYDTTYTVTVSTAAEDLAGNNLASDYTWTFTTEPTDETPPTITGVSPEDGATDVSVGTTISATFSEAMNESSAAAAFSVDSVAGTFSWAGNMMTFTPSSALAYDTTYTVTVSTAAEDLAGNNLASDNTWQFTTGRRYVSRGGGGGAPRDTDGDGYSDIQEMLAGTAKDDPCDPDPECAACLASKPAATPTPTAAPTVTPTPTIPPVVTTPTPTPTPPVEPPVKRPWGLIIGIIIAVVIVGAAAYYVYTKKKA